MAEGWYPAMDDLCGGCKHRYGSHTQGKLGRCIERDCTCPHWFDEAPLLQMLHELGVFDER